MKICLKTYAKHTGNQHVSVHLTERLPLRVQAPCTLACDLSVESHAGYYLLDLSIRGKLGLTCQRCLGDFSCDYANQIKLAVCANDAMAETLMTRFDATVSSDYEIDLNDIIADDLHLFAPEKHSDPELCDHDVNRLINGTR